MKRIYIRHETVYEFGELVRLGPHKLMIRPRTGHDIFIENANLVIAPANCTVSWQRDIYGNSVAIVVFHEPSPTLRILSEVTLQHFESEPLNFLVDDKALTFPFPFDPQERVDLIPYQTLCFPSDSSVLREWLQSFWKPGQIIETYVLLDNLNKAIVQDFQYSMREEPGVQRPSVTLAKRSGSCRDFATLYIEACRYFGLPARFASGYLNCPNTVQGHGATHAWAEVYLPGAGWKGFDNTSGNVVGHDHITVAVTRHPADAPPISGTFASDHEVHSKMKVEVSVKEI